MGGIRKLFLCGLVCFSAFGVWADEAPIEGPKPQTREDMYARISNKKFIVGLEAGFSANLLISDPKTGAFGTGLGHHYGIYANFSADKRLGVKVRVERVTFEESIIGDKITDSIYPNSFLKWMQQQYWITSVGGEWRSEGHFGRQFFADLLLGYGIGQPSQYTLFGSNDGMHPAYINPENNFFISFGAGFRREFGDSWNGVFSARTDLSLRSVYSGPFAGELYIPVPIMFSFGVEREF